MATMEPRKKWATPEDWAAHRQTIVDLYRDRELEEVMEIMEREHNFHSTKKIYKTRFKEWDVGKRLNDADVLTILHLRAQRDAAAKQSEFWIMGRRVSEANIQRYLRRKPQLLARYRRGYRPPPPAQSPHEVAAPRLACVTPPPPPAAVWRLAGAAAETELLLADCRDYFRASGDSGEWRADGADGVVVAARAGRRGSAMADDALVKFYTAADLLYRSNFPGAFKVLDLAFRATGEAVALNVPRLLSLLLIVFKRLADRGQGDTLNILRRYVRGRADAVDGGEGGNNGKLPTVLRRVSALEAARYDDVFPRVYELMIAQADAMFGAGGNLSLEIYWHMFGAYVMRRDTGAQVRSLARELEKMAPDDDDDDDDDAGPRRRPWVLRHRRLYAWKTSQVERDAGRFDEALAALRTVEHTYAGAAAGSDCVDASRHWGFAGMIESRRGDLAAAERYFRLSVKMAMGTADEDAVQYSLFKLTDVLDKMGRAQEAERIREYGRGRIDEMTAQVQWDWDEFQARTAVEPVTIPSPAEEAASPATVF